MFCKILSSSLHVSHHKWAGNQCNRGLTHYMRSILNILHFNSKVEPGPPNASFQWTDRVWSQVVIVGSSTLHQQPCATTPRLLPPQLISHWIKRSPPVTVYGRALHSRAQAALQYTHQTAAIRPLTHEEPFRESVSHSLSVFGYWLEESYQQQMMCSGGYSSDKGRWVRRSQRGGWRGSWRGRSLSGHAPPPDSIPCFHAYRETPPPAAARRPSEKARERSSQWSHSPRTPADGERRVSVEKLPSVRFSLL